MTSALSGRTTKLIRNNVIVAEIMGIPDEDYTSDAIDATNSDSLLGFREYVSGPKTGTFSVSGNLIPGDTGQDGIRSDFEGGASQNYELAFPNAFSSSCELSAIVTDYSEEYPYDGVVKFNASFQVTGAATFIEDTGSGGLTTPFFVVTGDISGVLTPSATPAGSTYEYIVTPGITDTYVTVTPTAATGTIYVNGTVVATGVASDPISVGSFSQPKNIFIEVKEVGKAPKIYLIGVTPVHNLLNIGFELWSNGPSADPDGWASTAVLTVNRSTDSYLGAYAMEGVSSGAGTGRIDFNLGGVGLKTGQLVTFSMWIKTSSATHVGIQLVDFDSDPVSRSTGSGIYELLTVSKTWVEGLATPRCSIFVDDGSSDAFIADSAKLTIS